MPRCTKCRVCSACSHASKRPRASRSWLRRARRGRRATGRRQADRERRATGPVRPPSPSAQGEQLQQIVRPVAVAPGASALRGGGLLGVRPRQECRSEQQPGRPGGQVGGAARCSRAPGTSSRSPSATRCQDRLRTEARTSGPAGPFVLNWRAVATSPARPVNSPGSRTNSLPQPLRTREAVRRARALPAGPGRRGRPGRSHRCPGRGREEVAAAVLDLDRAVVHRHAVAGVPVRGRCGRRAAATPRR